MADGANAAIVPCLKCAEPAHRTYEGPEDDRYRCSEHSFEFAMDWSYDGPPQRPRWPSSEEEAEKI